MYDKNGRESRRDDMRDDRRDNRRDDRYDDRYDDRHDDRVDSRRDDYRRDDRYDDYRRDDRRDDYDDDRQVRDEIERLKREIYALKDSLDRKGQENADLRMMIKQADRSNQELLSAITKTLSEMSQRMDGMDEEIGSNIKKMQSTLKDDLDDMNLPIEAKCDSIEERLKTLQNNLDYADPMKEQLEAATEGMRETLAERFGSKTIGDVLQKLATINTFLIADSIGIVVLLALMCFFIISLL